LAAGIKPMIPRGEPLITAETEKEIPNAKNIVESSLTEEMIEDEAYDPIMVAEYGDEIFSYMKELEVRPCCSS
jgi:G2/mitotic-specific cyclin 3/4